jgi:peptidylamidoglycolate lyase
MRQVSAVSTNPDDDPVVFHRGPIVWDGNSFDDQDRLVARDGPPIAEDTILVVDQYTGKVRMAMKVVFAPCLVSQQIRR